MLTIQVFGVFFIIALAGIPLFYALIATTAGMVYFKDLPYQMDSLLLNLIAGVEPFILIAVPLFIFAGELLSQGGVGKRIVALASVLFGWMPGGNRSWRPTSSSGPSWKTLAFRPNPSARSTFSPIIPRWI